jgi:hypothetical protein
VFNVKELPVNKFAASLGLLGTPKIRFLNKKQKDARQGVPVEQNAADEEYNHWSFSVLVLDTVFERADAPSPELDLKIPLTSCDPPLSISAITSDEPGECNLPCHQTK